MATMVFRQRGSALLVALLITAIAAILASANMEAGLYSYHQSLQHLRMQQARQLSMGLEDWAITILRKDRLETANKDSQRDLWNRELPPTESPGGLIQGRMTELSGRFNLNSLVDTRGQPNVTAMQRFSRLLDLLELDPAITDQIVDRIDRDSSPRPLGAEDGSYLGYNPPRLAANVPFVHSSELLLLPTVTTEVYDALSPYVFAAPFSDTSINVNTAPEAVLIALAPQLDAEIARQIIASRTDGFASYPELMQMGFMQNIPLKAEGLSFGSEYFLARITMLSDNRPLYFESLLQRRGNQYHVLFRRQGSY
jgi:general secretion pathway protein K